MEPSAVQKWISGAYGVYRLWPHSLIRLDAARTMSTSRKRIYRSDDRVVAGVLGGFAEYFGVEPTVFRLAIVFLIVATGIVPGIATYVVAVLIMPKGPDEVPDAPPTARRKTGSGDGERKSRNTETGPEKTADDEETDGGEQPRTPRE